MARAFLYKCGRFDSLAINSRVSIREVTNQASKMKSTLSTALLLVVEANPTADVLPPMAQPRRYRDLDSMIAELNPNFDPRKYWAYGCHCFALDDRPMSGMGKGKPVDELDALCKRYKDCQKCARKIFGEV